MIVSDWAEGRAELEAHGFVAKVTEVLAIYVADRPGGLAEMLGRWTGAESTSSICMPSPMFAAMRPF